MTRIPDSSIFLQNQTGDSGFENVYIYGKLNYDFGSEDIVLNSLNVTGISSFTGNVKFTGDIEFIEISRLGNKEEWRSYDGFKAGESNRKEKQQKYIENYQIYTSDGWSDINRVIRHKTTKKIYI